MDGCLNPHEVGQSRCSGSAGVKRAMRDVEVAEMRRKGGSAKQSGTGFRDVSRVEDGDEMWRWRG